MITASSPVAQPAPEQPTRPIRRVSGPQARSAVVECVLLAVACLITIWPPPGPACRSTGSCPLDPIFPSRPKPKLIYPSYDPGMSDRKARLTITVDPHLSAYAEYLVETGKAPSVSAVFNDALAERVERDKRIRRRWKEITAEADTAQVERMIAHAEAQAEQLPASHRYR